MIEVDKKMAVRKMAVIVVSIVVFAFLIALSVELKVKHELISQMQAQIEALQRAPVRLLNQYQGVARVLSGEGIFIKNQADGSIILETPHGMVRFPADYKFVPE